MGDLFKIENTKSFDKEKLVLGKEYDYVTRTSFNQGILQTTGFVNEDNINPAGNWSLGLLQMDFFYRKKSWYAGQFIRKITPKINIPEYCIPFFTTILNGLKNKLLTVLVRDVDKLFNSSIIQLPIKNNEIDFEFMESFVAELEAQRIAELEAYLIASGLDDYKLTLNEENALSSLIELEWEEKYVTEVFEIKNTKNILSSEIVPNSGTTPYLCASADNNSVSSYISYKEELLDKGNCVFIGGKTFVVSYQEFDFFSNDSHNLVLYLKDEDKANKINQLYLATCVRKSLSHKYSWGDSISNKKIQNDKIMVPVKNDKIDYDVMNDLISAIQKLVIKDVVDYADDKIEKTKQVVNNR